MAASYPRPSTRLLAVNGSNRCGAAVTQFVLERRQWIDRRRLNDSNVPKTARQLASCDRQRSLPTASLAFGDHADDDMAAEFILI